jgi:orotidine-5'-phosphate decarboxylase
LSTSGRLMRDPPRLIVALDQPDLAKAEALAGELSDRAAAFKIGLTLFSAYGPEAISEIGRHGPVFCDLKFHDIPHQVGAAAGELARLGVWMFTVHAAGGAAMVAAAVKGADTGRDSPLVAAVTVLTSLKLDRDGLVDELAETAVGAGAPALVCSAGEVAGLRLRLGEEVLLVVPGIRRANDEIDDQARTATPEQVARKGADYVVVGRPITQAADPRASAEVILRELGW